MKVIEFVKQHPVLIVGIVVLAGYLILKRKGASVEAPKVL